MSPTSANNALPGSYAHYVENMVTNYEQLAGNTANLQPILPLLVKPTGLSDQPRIAILAPHPDDECLMAGAALRMQEEWNAKVTVIPYSYGSRPDRRAARAQELKDSLAVLGFDLFEPRKNTLQEKMTEIEFLETMKKLKPEIIFSPHANDFHPAHIAAHDLVENYLSSMVSGIKPIWILTEYWRANETPNSFVPLSPDHVIKIGEALMKHAGEVSRNPYHLRLPAWYID